MRLIARFLVVAAAVGLVAAYVPGVEVQDGVGSYLLIALTGWTSTASDRRSSPRSSSAP